MRPSFAYRNFDKYDLTTECLFPWINSICLTTTKSNPSIPLLGRRITFCLLMIPWSASLKTDGMLSFLYRTLFNSDIYVVTQFIIQGCRDVLNNR